MPGDSVILLIQEVSGDVYSQTRSSFFRRGVAGAPGSCAPDGAGVCRLPRSGHGVWHLCSISGPAGLDAHADGHRRLRRLAGICAGKPAAGGVRAAVGLSDGPDDPGAAPVLRTCHAGALQRLWPAQRLHDLRHERRDLFHHLLGRTAGRGGPGLVHVLRHPAGSALLGGQRRAGRGDRFGPALQYRGRGFRDDGHVRGHLPEPVGKRKTARQRPHRAAGAAGLPGAFWGRQSFLLPAMACILVLLVALRRPIESIEAKHGETEVPK